ncbi:MAG: RluA family pseudouridine synthase [Mogibacterium sp.]|nr:RluA family pseudouridine synthase [Mogibacterium sp.]
MNDIISGAYLDACTYLTEGDLMRDINITSNDAGRRLDRFLRKYLGHATLAEIYKIIRKDVKVNGKRKAESYMLAEGDVLTLYLADETIDRMTGGNPGRQRKADNHKAKRQFRIIYEDSNILAADKPYGLLTHGDSHEKKNHLANQVKDYLIEQGEFDPSSEKVFSPAPANRIDRNTTGLVLFGKTAASLKSLNKMIRDDMIDKFYLTIVHGRLTEEMTLTGSLIKDQDTNKVSISADDSEGLHIVTVVRPVETFTYAEGFTATLVEVHLVTGRSHQIRAHLASIGHPVIGDTKYAARSSRKANDYLSRTFRLSTQLLHAYRVEFRETTEDLQYLKGRQLTAPVPPVFDKILASMREGR